MFCIFCLSPAKPPHFAIKLAPVTLSEAGGTPATGERSRRTHRIRNLGAKVNNFSFTLRTNLFDHAGDSPDDYFLFARHFVAITTDRTFPHRKGFHLALDIVPASLAAVVAAKIRNVLQCQSFHISLNKPVLAFSATFSGCLVSDHYLPVFCCPVASQKGRSLSEGVGISSPSKFSTIS